MNKNIQFFMLAACITFVANTQAIFHTDDIDCFSEALEMIKELKSQAIAHNAAKPVVVPAPVVVVQEAPKPVAQPVPVVVCHKISEFPSHSWMHEDENKQDSYSSYNLNTAIQAKFNKLCQLLRELRLLIEEQNNQEALELLHVIELAFVQLATQI